MPDITAGEDSLALEVARIDHIVIDQRKASNPARGEVLQSWRADPAQTDNRDMLARQRDLPSTTDFRQHDVPRKPIQAARGERCRKW